VKVVLTPGGSHELPFCTSVVHNIGMSKEKTVRSENGPSGTQHGKTPASKSQSNVHELVEEGLEAKQQKEKSFFEFAERFRAAADPKEVERLGEELGQMVFGK
jgi:hypothetical protein